MNSRTQSVFDRTMFKGKTVLISGGATGIGYEISKQFLLHGASVYIISRKIDNINKAIKSLAESTGNTNISGSSCDVRNEKQIEQTVKKVFQSHGSIDILVNGAAGNFLCPFDQLTPNGFKTVLMIDTVGTFLLSKYVNDFGFKNGGVIINITANLYYSGTALQAHAGTAKAGVDALTKHMAVELGPKNIRVVGICPGVIGGTEGYDRLSTGSDQQVIKLIPLQRIGQSTDIAKCALFLASPAASYITGSTILVDGGFTLTSSNFPFFNQTFLQNYAKGNLTAKL